MTIQTWETGCRIVKRLRDERSLGDRVTLARAAADEIERLTQRIHELEAELNAVRVVSGPG